MKKKEKRWILEYKSRVEMNGLKDKEGETEGCGGPFFLQFTMYSLLQKRTLSFEVLKRTQMYT